MQEVGEDEGVEAPAIRRSRVTSSDPESIFRGPELDEADAQSEDGLGVRSPFIPDNFDIHIRTQECAVCIDRLL
jgi:hypothetical protein